MFRQVRWTTLLVWLTILGTILFLTILDSPESGWRILESCEIIPMFVIGIALLISYLKA